MYGVPLQTDLFETVGIAMHPWLAGLSHSCNPNSIIVFDSVMNLDMRIGPKRRLRIIPIRPIPRGEKITIAFIDGSAPVSLRKQHLKTNYFFDCDCSKCINDSTSPAPQLTESQIATLDKVGGLVDAAEQDTSCYMPVRRLRYALHVLLSCSWDKTMHPYPLVVRRLIQACISDERYVKAFALSVELSRVEKNLYKDSGSRTTHPIRMMQFFTTMRLVDKMLDARAKTSGVPAVDAFDLKIYGCRRYWATRALPDLTKRGLWQEHRNGGQKYLNSVVTGGWAHQEFGNKKERDKEFEKLARLADQVLEGVKNEEWLA